MVSAFYSDDFSRLPFVLPGLPPRTVTVVLISLSETVRHGYYPSIVVFFSPSFRLLTVGFCQLLGGQPELCFYPDLFGLK